MIVADDFVAQCQSKIRKQELIIEKILHILHTSVDQKEWNCDFKCRLDYQCDDLNICLLAIHDKIEEVIHK
jgi:hypothetical protein